MIEAEVVDCGVVGALGDVGEVGDAGAAGEEGAPGAAGSPDSVWANLVRYLSRNFKGSIYIMLSY